MVFSKRWEGGDEGIVIENGCSLFLKEIHDGEGRRFPGIIDILLIGDSQDQDFCSFNAFASLIEGIHRLRDHIVRDGDIDLSGQLDKFGCEIIFSGFPE